MEEQSRLSYTPSKPVLIGIAVLTWILVNGNLPSIGYVLCFGFISVFLEGDYVLYLLKEEVKHGASGKT